MIQRTSHSRCAADRSAILVRAAVVVLCLALLFACAPVARAQTFTVHVRAGPVLSTPLVEDAIAAPGVMARLFGDDFAADHPVAPVRARPGLGAGVTIGAARRLVDDWLLEADVGWTFAELLADDGRSARPVQDMGIGHVLLALRRDLGRFYHVRAGLGALRHFADPEGLFGDGTEIEPLLEAGAGVSRSVGGLRLGLDLVGQAHSFGTPALRRARGRDGTVYRIAIQASAAYDAGAR